MTRRLGGNGRRNGLAVLATCSLAATLAFGGSTVGCGSSNSSGDDGGSSGGSSSGGPEGGFDAPPGMDAPAETTGKDSGGPDVTGMDVTGMDVMPDVPEPTAATPVFMPMPGTFPMAQNVTITCATMNSTIYYTTNMTQPGPANPASLVYSMPIAVTNATTMPVTTTIRAVCVANGYQDSAIAVGAYTINPPPPGTLPTPTPNPVAGTLNNDFRLSLTDTPGATICYTLDGSMPSCSAGVCGGTSKTYDASAQIAIDGTVTNAATGQVTVQAIACEVGFTTSMPALTQTYTLQVASPQLQGPPPSTLTYNVATPIVTATVSTITNNATALFTTKASIGAMVSCTNGTPVTNGMTTNAAPLPEPFPIDTTQGAQTFWIVGCKTGYAASTVSTNKYQVLLNQPVFKPAGGATYNVNKTVNADDSANNGLAGEYVCYTSDGKTAPQCGTTTGMPCAAGTQLNGGGSNSITYSANSGKVDVNGAILQAVACTSTATTDPVFVDSSTQPTPPYTFQLDPMQFANGATVITSATAPAIPTGGTLSITASESLTVAGDKAYDFICYSKTVAVAAADCAAGCVTGETKVAATTTGAVTIGPSTSAVTLSAVGCLNAATAGSPDVYLPAVGSITFPAAGTMNPPTITPGATINNPTVVQFVNNASVPAYFCYTTDGSTPGLASTTNKTCFAHNTVTGSTTCTNSPTAAGASSSITDTKALKILTTGTTVNAIACDAASVLKASDPATPIDYTLVAGNPAITPTGPVALGQAIAITTATWPTATNALSIAYSEDGTTPDCTAAFPQLAVTCGGVACKCGAGACTDPTVMPSNGPFTATYYAMGGQGNTNATPASVGGTLKTVTCATNYTTSPVPATSTLTPFSTPAPTILMPSGTYYDQIIENLALSPAGATSGWFCAGAGATCGSLANTCNAPGGAVSTVQSAPAGWSIVPFAGVPGTHAGGQPSIPPTLATSATTAFILPSLNAALPNTVTAIACQMPGPAASAAGTATMQSSSASTAAYQFKVSAVGLTSPATTTNLVGSQTLTFSETLVDLPPNGSASPAVPGGTNGASNATGGPTQFCWTTQTLPTQPGSCATLPMLTEFKAPLGNCVQSTGNPQSNTAVGPLTVGDVGTNSTYSLALCKDLMTWNTASVPLTFTPYTHTVAMTGSAVDFSSTKENIQEAPNSATAFAYASFDAMNLYLGLTVPTLSTTTDFIQAYIGSSNGTGAPDTGGVDTLTHYYTGAVPNFPAGFNALYHVFWKVDNTSQGINAYTGGAWTAVTGAAFTVKFNLTSQFIEFSIPLSALASAKNAGAAGGYDLHLLGGDWNATTTTNVSEWPAVGASGNSNVANWSQWQLETTNDAFAPNDSSRVNVK
jgi:hypothetical protein